MEESNRREERFGENHVVLVESIRRKIQPMLSRRPSIFKVSTLLREGKEDMFVPKVVSIGPFHRGKESLQNIEEQKKWYLHALLSRTSASLEQLLQVIMEVEEEARGCYAESINLNRDEFVEMMLFDGCFILQSFYNYANATLRNEDSLHYMVMHYRLRQDLILLENQLPFIVLDRLFNITRIQIPGQEDFSLNQVAMSFFDDILPTYEVFKSESSIKGKHLLDLIRNNLVPPSYHQPKDIADSPMVEYTYSATDLWEAGVDFKEKSNAPRGLLDITFSEHGVLEIPRFYLGAQTKYLLQNLIALEEYDFDCTTQITSYVIFMDILINSQKDVRLLRDKGIMECYRDHEEVAHVINKLGKGISFVDEYYDGLCFRVNKYYKSDWHKWRATLKRNYFNNPWSIISVVAASILLILTFLQTIFSILPK